MSDRPGSSSVTPVRPGPAIIVSAGFQSGGERGAGGDAPLGLALEIEEALVSLGRAAFSHHIALAVPADPMVTPLLAQVACEYVVPRKAEPVAAPEMRSQLDVFMTTHQDSYLEQLLRDVVGRGAVGLHRDPEAPDSEQPGGTDTFFERTRSDRQPITQWMVGELRRTSYLIGAVVIGGSARSREETVLLRAGNIRRVTAIGPTIGGELSMRELEQYGVEDIVEQVLQQNEWWRTWRATNPSNDSPAADPRVTPYAYVMQQMLTEWL